MVRTAAILAALLILSSHGLHSQTTKSTAQPILIDTDIGDDIDDAFAIAYALRTPGFHILGITTTFGDTSLRADIVAHLLHDAQASAIPIGTGAPTPPKGSVTQAVYGNKSPVKVVRQDAVTLILQTATAHPGKVTLIAIGPLMNIGAAIDRNPSAFRKLKRVVVMGGSITHGYNDDAKTSGPSSEWNIRNDPASLRKLLASGVPVYLMPLDSTQIALPPVLQKRILQQTDPLSQALAELVREAHRNVILYDPLTVAFADDPKLCPTKPMHIEVDDRGYTRPSPGTANAQVCLQSDESAFLQIFAQRLSKN